MAVRSSFYYWPVCDRCEEPIGRNDDDLWPLSDTEARAREDVEYYDGRFEKDGSFTCADCIEDEPVTATRGPADA